MNAENIFQHLKNEDWRTKNDADDVWDVLDVLGYEESVFGFLSEIETIPAESKLFNAYVSFLPTGESDEHVQIHFADESILSKENGEWKISVGTGQLPPPTLEDWDRLLRGIQELQARVRALELCYTNPGDTDNILQLMNDADRRKKQELI